MSVEILKKQRKFAVKLCLIAVVIMAFCGYLEYQDTLCTEPVEAIVTKSVRYFGRETADSIGTEYTYSYNGKTYKGSRSTSIQYEKGDSIQIYVNPNRPSKSIAEHMEWEILPAKIVLGIMFGFGFYVVVRRSMQIRELQKGSIKK